MLPESGFERIPAGSPLQATRPPVGTLEQGGVIDPDVLCLQEVPRRLFSTWRVSAFAQECGMFWSGRHRGSGGTTVFTSLRVQVPESRHYRLRVAALQRTRGYAVLRVGPAGHQPLVVASVHLSLDGTYDGKTRSLDLATLTGGQIRELRYNFRYLQNFDQDLSLPLAFKPEQLVVEVQSSRHDVAPLSQTFLWNVEASP